MDFQESDNNIQELLSIFQTESEELIERVINNLILLETNPSDRELTSTLYRELHSIKGAIRMVGFNNIQTIIHKIEDIFDVVSSANKGIATRISHQSDHNLNIRISRPLEIYSAMNSSSATVFIRDEIESLMKNIYYEGDVCVSSVSESFISNATILCFLFASLSIDADYLNTVDALVNLKDASETMAINENIDCIDCQALIELIRPIYIDANISCNSEITASIEFDEASWQNPELINGDLFVYRVLDVVQSEETIFIDCEVEE